MIECVSKPPSNSRINDRLHHKRVKRHDSKLKLGYLKYISECVRQNRNSKSIISDLEESYGPGCIARGTIKTWISAMRCEDREYAAKILGSQFVEYYNKVQASSASGQQVKLRPVEEEPDCPEVIEYWHTLHPESYPAESSNRSVTSGSESTASEAGSTMAVEENHDELPEIIEIKYEPADGFLKLPIKPNGASLMQPHSTTRISKREPHCILGKATLNGQTYFMVKWKGPFEDELSKFNFLFIFCIFYLFIVYKKFY